jgi:hypothetical protein
MSVQKVNQTTGATTPIAGVPAKKINGIQDTINKNGAKNLLPNNGSSETVGNITFTKNADGSVTINGTNNNGGLVFYKICENIAWGNTELNIGITSFPTEARYGNYLFSLEGDHSVTFVAGQVAFGYTVSNTTTWIAINDGVTVNNLTVYPMVRLASDTDNTYVPYAMTNSELTERKKASLSTTDFPKLFKTAYLYMRNGVVQLELNGFVNLSQGENTAVITLPQEFRPDSVRRMVATAPGTTEHYRLSLYPSGNVDVYCYSTSASSTNIAFDMIYIK